jgi:DNA-binding response OmpR family regulator
VSIGPDAHVLFRSGVDLPQYVLSVRREKERLVVELRGRSTRQLLQVKGKTRTALLYLLAREFDSGRCEGWLLDERAQTGVWGKGCADTNSLNVLIHRLRKNLRNAGFESIIERQRGASRLRRCEVRWT